MGSVSLQAAERETVVPAMGLAYLADAIGGKVWPDAEPLQRLLSHPRFREVCEKSMGDTLELVQNNRKTARVLIDIHRAIVGLFVLYLDAHGTVTHAAVRDFCVAVGLTTPGRATAVMSNLKTIGYIVPDSVQTDRRSRRYVLSQETRAFFAEAFRRQMVSLSYVVPQTLTVAERIEDPEIFKAIVLDVCNGLADAARRGDTTILSPIEARNGGIGIIYRLCVSGQPDDVFPPRRPVPLSINALASEFQVSRPHVRKLLRDAEAAGLVRRDEAASTIALEESFRKAIAEHHAVVLMGYAHAARAAMRAVGEMDQ